MASSSSDTDEDEKSRLRDAAVDMSSVIQKNQNCRKPEVKIKHIRYMNENTPQAEIPGLEITPEFKDFLAGKLSKALDNSIEEMESKVPECEVPIFDEDDFKLFSTSKRCIEAVKLPESDKKKRKTSSSSESSEDLSKFAEAAVSGETVLRNGNIKINEDLSNRNCEDTQSNEMPNQSYDNIQSNEGQKDPKYTVTCNRKKKKKKKHKE